MVLGQRSLRGRHSGCLIPLDAQSQRGPLRPAVESGGDTVQRSRIAGRSLPDRYMARHHRRQETMLKASSRGKPFLRRPTPDQQKESFE
jgi:hypothetical protein